MSSATAATSTNRPSRSWTASSPTAERWWGKYTELQELVKLVERGDVTLHTTRYGLDDINTVAEKLEHGEIEGRAVIMPS
ncbi:hypothetical protein BG842_08740 [Haladaptatus sp. W1]|nr:hypothetical protein BG842_08740 [Haladaptatus sp. W1]